MRMIGKGREALATVAAIMDLPPPLSHTSYSRYNVKRADQASACKMPRPDVASLTKYSVL